MINSSLKYKHILVDFIALTELRLRFHYFFTNATLPDHFSSRINDHLLGPEIYSEPITLAGDKADVITHKWALMPSLEIDHEQWIVDEIGTIIYA